MSLCDKFKNILSGYYRWFKPKEIEKPDCVLQLLKTLYPKVNWNKVHFYNNLPWYIPSSKTIAITLPGIYNFTRFNIYFNKNFDPSSYKRLGTMVHEGFHVLQNRDTGIFGVGFIRLFMVEYLGSWAMFGYKNSSMEVDAYEQEKHFNECYKALNKNICDCSTKPPTLNQNALSQLIASYPDLAKNTSGYHYNFDIFLAIIGVVLDILIAILLPILEFVLLLVSALLLVITGIVCGITWLWNIFAKLFRRK
ncbi:MAG: hypothetical protein HOO91_16555 [Bacteroidales bacterium]|nr:hypothetical protein [Bacteroidales bacterium]